jgi:tetratricopeptide (TPR) repeat protein
MKKFVFASVMALASICLVSAPTLRAQDSDTISIKDPAEFNNYQMATTQGDQKAKAAALENFLTQYPQSVVKSSVLDMLLDTYQGLGDPDHALSAASRLIQIDPNNMKAIFLSVVIKKSQGAKTGDAQTLDDAAALARKGLAVVKPAKMSDDDWKKQTSATYPIFHSAIALDFALAKKDYKSAVSEYRTELMLFPPEATKAGPGLVDTLQLAEMYIKPEVKDYVQAVWFYSRAWNFAPPAFKAQIEPKIEYYFKKYHGNLDGLDAIKAQAALTVFPADTFVISAAATPAEIAHKVVVETPDLNTLNLGDKEFILASGTKEDADKLWALMKDKATPAPGVVIEATASVIKLAVSDDAKVAKIADFIVNMKKPLEEKEIPVAGAAFGIQPAAELDGVYDSYAQIPATDTTAQAAQIVLRDGVLVPEKKKPAAAAHKPAAGHKAH